MRTVINLSRYLLTDIKDRKKMSYEPFRIKMDIDAKNSGYLFVVITENQIRSAKMQNVWLTLASSKVILSKSQINGLLKLVTKKGIQFNNLCYELSESLEIELPKAS